MEFKIEQNKLNKILAIVSRIASTSRTIMPILSNILIRVNKNKATFIATDLGLAIVDNVGVEVKKEGVVTVPARLMADFVANLPKNEVVSVKAENNKVMISAGKYRSTINSMLADDFPELPDIDEKEAVIYRITADDFKKSVGQVIMAVSNDSTRPILTGVFFNTYNNFLFIAATDGYRLADKKLIEDVKSEVKSVVPANALQEVLRCLNDASEEIEVLFTDSQVRFRFDEIEITSKIIDGSFPDYRQLIPKDTEINLSLDRLQLERMTKVAALFARSSGGSIVCEVKADEKKIYISSVANELGENNSDMDIVEETKDGKIVLNSRFLLDAINAIDEEKIRFGFSGKMTPLLMRAEKNNDYTHIIMPLKS